MGLRGQGASRRGSVAGFGLVLIALASCTPQGRATDDRINRVLGDESWIARFGEAPGDGASEEARIDTHLSYVEARLRATTPGGLGEAQRARRTGLLDALGEYRRRGVFPHNTERAQRTPRFIDDEGRACAVAYLMQHSGAGAVASQVNRDHEWAYVEDMDAPALDDWARQHGVSRRDLAMIQPGYGQRVAGPRPRPRRAALLAAIAKLQVRVRICHAQTEGVADSMLVTAEVEWPEKSGPTVHVSSSPSHRGVDACVTGEVQSMLADTWGTERLKPTPAVFARVSFRVTKPQSGDAHRGKRGPAS